MPEFILTWNPSKWVIKDESFDGYVADTSSGGEFEEPWSVGNRKGGIGFGDHAFLLRQHADRGIVASGYFTSEVYQDDRWDGSSGDANYAQVTWTTWLPLQERLPIDDLKARVSGVAWDQLQASGVQVPASAAVDLDDVWADHLDRVGRDVVRSPDEVPPSFAYREGAVSRIEVNRYERDPRARKAAIEHHGVDCSVCGFNFGAAYGDLGSGFIHVHHLRELSTLPEEYQMDPEADLIPVCANCHAMLHRERPALTPRQLRARLRM